MAADSSTKRVRWFEIVAQDPSVRDARGNVLKAKIALPLEALAGGPMGSALHVVDYDASTPTMYRPYESGEGIVKAPVSRRQLLADPGYHAMNVYAIVMRTLLRFEFALGRRVGWGIHGHQLKVVPHAFEDANAFYAPDLEALLFGYLRGKTPRYLCLSHDVVAHETAHALLDGLRDKFMEPSSADQAALHEAFADIVALLSVFSLREVVQHLMTPAQGLGSAPKGYAYKQHLTWDFLKDSALLGLAEELRAESGDARVNALRRSVGITPSRGILNSLEYQEEHRRGEVLVAAVMRAFVKAWLARIKKLGGNDPEALVDLELAAEQGADIADLLLTMTIRAIDYTPPIHIEFTDFLSAMLTADTEVRSDDSRYQLRRHLLAAMNEYGIRPASNEADGCWPRAADPLVREWTHFGSLQTDRTEMFRHLWRNRDFLELDKDAFTRVMSIRPCVRVSPEDGFQIRETVVECVQWLKVTGAELRNYQLRKPRGLPAETEVVLQAGSTLILDEYGDLKYRISNALPSTAPATRPKWNIRIAYLWAEGYIGGANRSARLATFHLERALAEDVPTQYEGQLSRRLKSEAWSR